MNYGVGTLLVLNLFEKNGFLCNESILMRLTEATQAARPTIETVAKPGNRPASNVQSIVGQAFGVPIKNILIKKSYR
jgi:hypothetical protein